MNVLGIDVGGTGIKSAVIDTTTGALLTDRYRISTPQPAIPETMMEVILDMIDYHQYDGKVGICFPSNISNHVVTTANNIDKSWIGIDLKKELEKRSSCNFVVHNDADMAGMAEMKLGAGKDKQGKVILLTIGTGLGSGMFFDGALIPNLELGSMEYKGKMVEKYASRSARKGEDLSWEMWGKRFNKFLQYVEMIVSPDLIILGGGDSKKFEKFEAYIDIKSPIEIAHFRNNAGIIGAALSTLE